MLGGVFRGLHLAKKVSRKLLACGVGTWSGHSAEVIATVPYRLALAVMVVPHPMFKNTVEPQPENTKALTASARSLVEMENHREERATAESAINTGEADSDIAGDL